MTIKEIEAQSGMTRANIRFYEQEGLIDPLRRDNGYRDYTEEDLRQLRRIRLLRTLGLSLEEIRSLQKGSLTLESALAQQAAVLEQQAADAQQRAVLCRKLSAEGISYSALDAAHWLDTLATAEPAVSSVPQEDTYHKVRAPWRRFFARYFDRFLYITVWILLGLAVLRLNPSGDTGSGWYGCSALMSTLMMLFLEPLLLATWGTTPGKWLLGLSVRNNTGQKLSFGESICRTAQVLWSGLGFFIPIFTLIRGYRSYYDCEEGKTMAWEWDSELQLRDKKPWRIGAFLGGTAALVAAIVLAAAVSSAPEHRGDMTVAEFTQSYNRLADFYELESRLTESGQWEKKTYPSNSVVISLSDIETPDYTYTESDGIMTGLSFHLTVDGDTENWVPLSTTRHAVAMLAYAQAYDPSPLNNEEALAVIKQLETSPFTPLDETVHGVRITWNVVSSGYRQISDAAVLAPIEDQAPHCDITFTIEKAP